MVATFALGMAMVGQPYLLTTEQLARPAHNTSHMSDYGATLDGYNFAIIQAVDRIQSRFPDGGGYFADVKADPPECGIGYPLELFGERVNVPTRKTSFCTGASYAALIEGLNLILATGCAPDGTTPREAVGEERMELFHMQEPDGSRREDKVKFWGWWNADGWGCHYALVQYAGLGERVEPMEALPGDFMNISWTNGGGHSAVFLGWHLDEEGGEHLKYWSSQQGTNGIGDQLVPMERVRSVVIVRLSKPLNLFTFSPTGRIETGLSGSVVNLGEAIASLRATP